MSTSVIHQSTSGRKSFELDKLPDVRRLVGETPDQLRQSLAIFKSPKLLAQALCEWSGIDEIPASVPENAVSRVQFFSDEDINDSLLIHVIKICLTECINDACERASMEVEAISNAYFILENEILHPLPMKRILVMYIYYDVFGLLEEWFKFQTTYLSALLLKQIDLPPVPDWIRGHEGFLCGGKFYRRMRQLLNKAEVTKEVATWAFTVLGLKRGCAPIRPELVLKSLEKHQSALSKEPTEDPLFPDVYQGIDVIVRSLRPELVGDLGQNLRKVKWRMPSASSHYGWSRLKHGAIGSMTESIVAKYGIFAHEKTNLACYVQSPKSGEIPIYVPKYMDEIYDFIIGEAKKESLDCDVHVVLEPMKARIITSGPAMRYHVCRMLQKSIHGALRKQYAFQLIGGPVTQELLSDNFSGMPSNCRSTWEYVSADYSAATDNLNGLLSKRYVECVIDCLELTGDPAEIYRESMLDHIMHYPEEFGVESVLQRNGQLMGSPSSFPGLCVINMAILLCSYRSWLASLGKHREIDLDLYTEMVETLRPLVNGDDLLFRSPKDLINIWEGYVDRCGLQRSPGKNYRAKDFAVINSTIFLLSESLEYDRNSGYDFGRTRWVSLHCKADRCHWVGSGLLRGQARVLSDTRWNSDDNNVDFGQLRSQLEWLLSWNCDNAEEIADRTKSVWLHYCGAALRSTDRSWRLPIALGGLGIPLGSATRPQLVLANMIIKTQDWKLSSQLQPRSASEHPIARLQLQRECELLKKMGCVRVPESKLPFFAIPTGEASEDGVRIVQMVDASVCNATFPEWLVGLPGPAELEEAAPRSLITIAKLMPKITNFNGGPMTLENALIYSEKMVWMGSDCALPRLSFVSASPNECDMAWHLENEFWERQEEKFRSLLEGAADDF